MSISTSTSTSTSSIGRRRLLAGSGIIGGSIFAGLAPAVLAQSRTPLRIGALNSYSKVTAEVAMANLNGMTLYFDLIGNSVAGRKVQIIREDDETNPQVGLQKLRKLHESDKCDLITGLQSSNVALAIVDYLRQSKAFTLCSGAGAASLSYTQLPYFFRCSVSSATIHRVMGEWFYDNVSKEVLLTGSDYAGGRLTLSEFKTGFFSKGGKVTQEIYPPLGNNDFSSYMASIRSANSPATFSFYAGADAVRFVKQYDEYGLKQRSRLTGSGFMFDSDTLPAQGKSALGALNVLHYGDTLDNPANKKFVAEYRVRFKEYPNYASEAGYLAAQIIHRALESVDGNTEDKDRLRSAMLAFRTNAPRGPFRFNPATQSPTQNVYIREVAEIEGRVANKVILTIPSVIEPANKPG